jgi:DNA primase
VGLPEGADPADVVQHEGGVEQMRAAIAAAVPFVRFRVERALAQGDYGSPEGRDRVVGELRPVFATLPPSAMRMELTRLVSGRLELPESVAERLLAREQPQAPARQVAGVLSRREETERSFLVLCLASPEEGARALAEVDMEGHFTSALLRRVAEHLRDGGLREPMKGDPDLAGVLAELVVEAGREEPQPAMLEVQRLQLELARVDRQIQAARGQGAGDVSDLAHRRGQIKREFDGAYERALEQTGA